MTIIEKPMAMSWDAARWPNFSAREIACPCCGALVVNRNALDALQKLRTLMAAPLKINSAVRCTARNKRVGGGKFSKHLMGVAFDIACNGHDRRKLYWSAQVAGFSGFGFMENALHTDVRPVRACWHYGPQSESAWAGILPPGTKQTGIA